MKVTPGHPIYVENEVWLLAENLELGDRLRRADGGIAKVLAIERLALDEPQPVYNFTVKGPHTYFVLDAGVLVHNAPCLAARDIHTINLRDSDWKQSLNDLNRLYPDDEFVNILRDADAGLLLKVGKTSVKGAERRFSKYRGTQNRFLELMEESGLNIRTNLALDVMVVPYDSGVKIRDVEKQVHNQLILTEGHELRGDTIPGRPRPIGIGPGVPDPGKSVLYGPAGRAKYRWDKFGRVVDREGNIIRLP